jgi:hypothetical protein
MPVPWDAVERSMAPVCEIGVAGKERVLVHGGFFPAGRNLYDLQFLYHDDLLLVAFRTFLVVPVKDRPYSF